MAINFTTASQQQVTKHAKLTAAKYIKLPRKNACPSQLWFTLPYGHRRVGKSKKVG